MATQVTAMEAHQKELDRLNRAPGLSATVDKVDRIIEILSSAKDMIVQNGMLIANLSSMNLGTVTDLT